MKKAPFLPKPHIDKPLLAIHCSRDLPLQFAAVLKRCLAVIPCL